MIVFLNGMMLVEGVDKDYTVHPDRGIVLEFGVKPSDVLVTVTRDGDEDV